MTSNAVYVFLGPRAAVEETQLLFTGSTAP